MTEFLIYKMILIGSVFGLTLFVAAYSTYAERKVAAFLQDRVGPDRAGPFGIFQPLADGLKFIMKEEIIPNVSNKMLFVLGPCIAMLTALMAGVIIPWGGTLEIGGQTYSLQIADLNIGILYVFGVVSIGVYGIMIGGWSSNNKFSLLGAIRASAQMISYELPMSLAIVAPLLLVNTLNFRQIVEAQGGFWFGVIPKWNVFAGPMPQIFSFIIFVIAAFAETNRVPFDLPEAESELVAGFHTEYSSLMFAAFFTAEYANIVTVCCVATVLFLGGWQPLWPAAYGSDFVPPLILGLAGLMLLFHAGQSLRTRKWDRFSFPVFGVVFLGLAGLFLVPFLKPIIVPFFWFAAKAGFLIFVFIWIRGTLPRFRYDQLMRFAWTFLFPVAIVNLLVTGLLVALSSN